MSIKEKIGKRIEIERKTKGLTRKALADLTDDLSQSRINNYERGVRTPGPDEIRQLANALEVSPSFLMCLSDKKNTDNDSNIPGLGALIPLLNSKQACTAELIISNLKSDENHDKMEFLPISPAVASNASEHTFAYTITDDSMTPEFDKNDIVVIDPQSSYNPGDYVIAQIGSEKQVRLFQYKKLSFEPKDFEMVSLNENWPNISSKDKKSVKIIGKVIQSMRLYV